MNKIYIATTTVLSLAILTGGVVTALAGSDQSKRPAWVSADGRIDTTKMPDDAQLPYECWNGKVVTLSGKTFKQKENSPALPGSDEHKLGIAKMEELRRIPGIVTVKDGGEVVNIDESNPAVIKVMEKYEAKETPQCQ